MVRYYFFLAVFFAAAFFAGAFLAAFLVAIFLFSLFDGLHRSCNITTAVDECIDSCVISVKKKKFDTWKKRQQFLNIEWKIVFGSHRMHVDAALKCIIRSTTAPHLTPQSAPTLPSETLRNHPTTRWKYLHAAFFYDADLHNSSALDNV
jgi:hypothetical protein